MSAENHGTGAPEGDDPFAYLYRQEGGAGDSAAAAQQPGVPRRSYHQVRAVGERQYPAQGRQGYGAQAATAPYPQQDASPSPHYAAPETMPGGRAATRQYGGPGGGHGGGAGRGGRGGGNHNGLLIGAVAVVAAVVIGIGVAMLFTDGDAEQTAGGQTGTSAGPSTGTDSQAPQDEKDTSGKDKKDEKADLPKADAVSLHLAGGTRVASDIPGAKGKDGQYVAGINKPGASATWTTNVPEAGTYWLYVGYGVPGKDQHLTLNVNGDEHATDLNMKNFAHAEKGDWEHGWTYTYAEVTVDKGENTFSISCQPGDKCNVNLDQIWLAPPEKD